MLRYAFLSALLLGVAATDRPVIGVWAHEVDYPGTSDGPEYIAASYVKWVEMAGARVVPLRYNVSTDAELETLFNSLNGMLYPGGGVPSSRNAQKMFDMAVAANKRGDHFPVWGTCLGFEWFMQYVAGYDSIVTGGFDSENISIPLTYTNQTNSSTLLGGSSLEDQTFRAVLSDATPGKIVPFNAHGLGVTVEDFAKNENLVSFFDVLATSVDRNGKEFVAVVEGKGGMPIYATQFHPERNNFEWASNKEAPWLPLEYINHSPEAVKATQRMADTFVAEARKSTHGFADPSVAFHSLIWHYPRLSFEYFIFEQVYFVAVDI